jgi:hypothetical protein
MGRNQRLYRDHQHTPFTTVNIHETGFNYGIGNKNSYVPKDCERGESLPGDDDKLRVTAVIGVTTKGYFLPNMVIIKHSRSTTDESNFRVLKTLHQLDGFCIQDGWELKTWIKDIPKKNKNTDMMEMVEYRSLYLVHQESGHVIVSQHKAWMDQVKMSMYTDLILAKFKEEHGKLLVWMDNCPSHCTDFVKAELTRHSIDAAFFPPNMTAILQVLDLVVNGPIKAHTRSTRALKALNEFQEYLGFVESILEWNPNGEPTNIPEFAQSKPTICEAILDLIQMTTQSFNSASFKSGIERASLQAGLIPVAETGEFFPVETILGRCTKGSFYEATGLVTHGVTFTNAHEIEDEDQVDDEETGYVSEDHEETEMDE